MSRVDVCIAYRERHKNEVTFKYEGTPKGFSPSGGIKDKKSPTLIVLLKSINMFRDIGVIWQPRVKKHFLSVYYFEPTICKIIQCIA